MKRARVLAVPPVPRALAAAFAAALAVALAAAPARADDAIVAGSVVKVESAEIYVNLGTNQGVAGGVPLRIKRPIKLQHPVTRAAVEDWIPIGSATVTQAGAALSRAVVGDLVDRDPRRRSRRGARLAPRRAAAHTHTRAPRPCPRRRASTPRRRGARRVLRADRAVARRADRDLGALPLDARGIAVRGRDPRDLEALQALREQLRPPNAVRTAEPIEAVAHSIPAATEAGAAFPLVFVLERPEHVASAYLHYRTRDRRTYRRVLLVREHDIYLRGTMPAEVVQAPGVDYFVEVSTPDGGSGLALGSPARSGARRREAAAAHRSVRRPRRRSAARRCGSAASTSTSPRSTRATAIAAIGCRRAPRSTWRIGSTRRASASASATAAIVGDGGLRDVVWDDASPTPARRLPLRLRRRRGSAGPTLAVGGQRIAGVGKEGFGMGVEARARIGARDATNLQLLARSLPELGFAHRRPARDAARPRRPARDLRRRDRSTEPGDVGGEAGHRARVDRPAAAVACSSARLVAGPLGRARRPRRRRRPGVHW